MIFTDAARDLLKTLEGFSLTAYKDQKQKGGRWTIGWGHTGSEVVQGLVWSEERAELVFAEDVDRACAVVEHFLQHAVKPIADEQFSALTIFTFNEGATRFSGSTVLRDVLRGKLEAVPVELMRWVYAHDDSGVPYVVEGLVNRRKAEVALWNSAHPGGPATV
jgi:lysozyme